MFKNLSSILVVTASLAFAGTSAIAGPVIIDNANPANGIYDIYSTTFDGAMLPCGGGSPTYCSFFGGDPNIPRAIVLSPNPTGVTTGTPGGIGGPVVPGSFLYVDLTAGNTVAQISSPSTIALPPITLTIAGATTVTTSGAGFVIGPDGTAPINGLGQVEWLVNSAPGLAADFSTLGAVVTGCGGPLCGLLGVLSLDMVRYRLFLDFDPTFTSFTGNFIGQTANNSMVFATLNSGNPMTLVPVPAAAWLMASGLGLLGGLRRRSKAA